MSQPAVLTLGKREQTKVHNRQAILDAARDVFGEMGYDAATVRDVIRRTGLSVGAFYNYFRSKEELFEALVDDGARRFRPILHDLRESGPDFSAFVRRAVHAYLTFAADEHENWHARRPAGEILPHLRADTPQMLVIFDEVQAAVIDEIERRQADPIDAEYMAAACIAVAREVGERMLRRRPIDVDAAADFATAWILGGLAALPRHPA